MRKSIRAFTDEIIPADIIRSIVINANRAPSSKNTQPWELFLVQGDILENLRTDYLAAFDNNEPAAFEYVYSPDPLPESYKKRAVDLGKAFLIHKGIAREDKQKRREHDRENYKFFGANQVFFLAVEKNGYNNGTFLDCGLFLQSLITELHSMGIGSCPQYSVMAYSHLLYKHLPNTENMMFLLALPFGYPLAGHIANSFTTQREAIDNFFVTIK